MKRKEPVPESPQRTRIIEFSQELFFRYGFSRVTIDEIVAELHISKTTFYKLFKSKEEIFLAVVSEYYAAIGEGIVKIKAQSAGSYLDEFRSVTRFIAEKLERWDEKMRRDIRTSVPRIWVTIQDLQSRVLHSVLRSMLDKGIEKGILRRDIDPSLVARLMVIAIQNILNGEELRAHSMSFLDAFRTMTDILLQGILADGEKPCASPS